MRAACSIVVALLLAASSAYAYETDQYTNRGQQIADATDILNREVNATIAEIAENWSKGRNEMAFVNAIYKQIGGFHWVDKLEKWAMKSPEIEKLDIPRYGSIYSGHPPWAVRVTGLFGVGKTIRINDEFVGTDKIGHFLSQGRKFYKRYRRMGSEAKAAKRSVLTEKAIFGRMMTGTFSNADLVANYEGYRFYRSLFEDDVVAGKPAILHWDGDGWVVQREFDWADHVNAYWDEAINPNQLDRLARKHVRERLVGFCESFWVEPSLYMAEDRAELADRYAHIGMLDAGEYRLDVLCTSEAVYLRRYAGNEN